jgi:hypothetical protein
VDAKNENPDQTPDLTLLKESVYFSFLLAVFYDDFGSKQYSLRKTYEGTQDIHALIIGQCDWIDAF